MGELTPIDPTNLSDREVSMAAVRGVYQVHRCLEEHIRMWREHAEKSTEKREALAEDLLIAKGVALDTRAEVRDIALVLKVRSPDPGEERPKTNAVAAWGPKEAGAALAALVVALPVSVAGIGALWAFLHALAPSYVPSPPSLKS